MTKEDSEKSLATWVEWFNRDCRAQYVVHVVEDFNVRPKCHYCRVRGQIPLGERVSDPAPCVECTKCLNRMIWPVQYRPKSFDKSSFVCPPCTAGITTIVGKETNAQKISSENTTSWLV